MIHDDKFLQYQFYRIWNLIFHISSLRDINFASSFRSKSFVSISRAILSHLFHLEFLSHWSIEIILTITRFKPLIQLQIDDFSSSPLLYSFYIIYPPHPHPHRDSSVSLFDRFVFLRTWLLIKFPGLVMNETALEPGNLAFLRLKRK